MSRPVLVVGASPYAGGDVVTERLTRHPNLHLVPPADVGALPAGAGRILHGARDIAGDAVGDLAAELGAPLLGWLRERAQAERRGRVLVPVTSPPDLHAIVALLPDSDLILVVRDGQDAVAAARARDTSFERAVRAWLEGARAILAVTGRPLPARVRARLVRHEDLAADAAAILGSLLAWLDLPDSPAVREAVTPDPAVAPLTPAERARFAVRAATASRALGYPVPRADVATAAVAGAIEAAYAARRAVGRLVT